ncbi:MAG: hypothetical protein IJB74_05525 [Clostridia bacterium]|nr:hypothetical protein [Clostridia bacterium]
MKKLLSVVIGIAVIFGIITIMQMPKKGEIGETYISDGIEFKLNTVEFTDIIDGWGGANDDFWKPLDENNCNVGGRWSLDEYKLQHGLKAKNDEDRIVFISYNAKNVSKEDRHVDENGVINFDSGYEYSDGALAYRVSKEGVWQELDNGITLKKLKEKEYEFRAYIIVPKEAVESDKSLSLYLFGYKFKLR